jgi:hypothetical protein
MAVALLGTRQRRPVPVARHPGGGGSGVVDIDQRTLPARFVFRAVAAVGKAAAQSPSISESLCDFKQTAH